jgi:hypothetical protein
MFELIGNAQAVFGRLPFTTDAMHEAVMINSSAQGSTTIWSLKKTCYPSFDEFPFDQAVDISCVIFVQLVPVLVCS